MLSILDCIPAEKKDQFVISCSKSNALLKFSYDACYNIYQSQSSVRKYAQRHAIRCPQCLDSHEIMLPLGRIDKAVSKVLDSCRLCVNEERLNDDSGDRKNQIPDGARLGEVKIISGYEIGPKDILSETIEADLAMLRLICRSYGFSIKRKD